jgi:hypothetical protein
MYPGFLSRRESKNDGMALCWRKFEIARPIGTCKIVFHCACNRLKWGNTMMVLREAVCTSNE